MEIERPFEHLSNDELWKAIQKRRTSPKQSQLRLELFYRIYYLESEVERWKDHAKDYRAEMEREKEERERIEKLYMGV